MIQFPSQYKEEIKKQLMDDGRKKRIKIYWKNENIPNLDNASIKQESMTFTESINSNGEFKYGGGELCVLEFTAYGLPNVKGEVFGAVLEYILDGDFYLRPERAHLYYDETIDKYIASIPLGTYRVDECKKTGSNGLNERKILAYTDETVNPYLVEQFNASNDDTNITKPNIYINPKSFLAIQDKINETAIETITASAIKNQQAFYKPFLCKIGSDNYYAEFSIGYVSEYSNALLKNICMVNDVDGFNYPEDGCYVAVEFMCNELGILSQTVNTRGEIKRKLKEIYSIASKVIRNGEYIYNFGYADSDNTTLFPYHLLPWYTVKVSIIKNSKEVHSGTQRYANETITKLVRLRNVGMSSNASFLIEKPNVIEYEKWTTDFRKSFYELEGLVAQARNEFHPVELLTKGLVPHKGLYPHQGLYPSNSLYPETESDDDDIVVDGDIIIDAVEHKGYVESKDIKNLYIDEDKKVYGNIVFEWNNQAGNSQKFTWRMPTEETLDNLKNVRSEIHIVSRKDEEKRIVFTFDVITNNICNLTAYLPSKSNMTLMSLTPTDYFVIEAYSDDKKLFEIANNKEGYASGFIDEEINFAEHDYKFQKNDNSSGASYNFSGKLLNDACVGMNKIIIRTNENAVFPTQQIQPISIRNYDVDAINHEIEYIDGDTFVLDTSNMILDKGNLNSFALMYYVEKYDALLRNIDYSIVDADIKAMPHLEAGDMLEFHSPYANAKTIVMRRTMQGIQSLMDNIESN